VLLAAFHKSCHIHNGWSFGGCRGFGFGALDDEDGALEAVDLEDEDGDLGDELEVWKLYELWIFLTICVLVI